MMSNPVQPFEAARDRTRNVLFAPQSQGLDAAWLGEVDDLFRPAGLSLLRVGSGREAIARVERGGLAAAMLLPDSASSDGLALLRIIRSIDTELPCWLLTNDHSRSTLEAAFSLSVTCVIKHPPTRASLSLAVQRLVGG